MVECHIDAANKQISDTCGAVSARLEPDVVSENFKGTEK